MFKRRPPEGNVRRVTHINRNLRGVLTNKMGELVQYESFQEFQLILLLERNAFVVNYRSQPETFTFFDDRDGKKHSYTPDFKVWNHDGTIEIHEVTRSERQSRENVKRREDAAKKICRERNWKYFVHNETNLPNEAKKANLIFLFSFRPSIYLNRDIASSIRQLLKNNKRIQLLALAESVSQSVNLPASDALATVFHLLWHGQLETDLNKLILVEGCPSDDAFVWKME